MPEKQYLHQVRAEKEKGNKHNKEIESLSYL